MKYLSDVRLMQGLKVCLAVAFLLPLVGCRQPVTNPQANRSLFPNLFGSQQYANNSRESYLGLPKFDTESLASNGQSGRNIFGGGGRGQNAFGLGRSQNNSNSQGISDQRYNAMANELQGINSRLTAYDSDNQLLNTEVAALRQKLQLANQYNQTLKNQLADTSGRIQTADTERLAALQQLNQLQQQIQSGQAGQRFANNPSQTGQLVGFENGGVPSQFGNATIRANNSLMQRFANIRIPGGQARMDGDVIRIEFPSDRFFVPGTYQVQPAQQPLLQNIVATIRQSFPRQIVGIEAHWDNTPLNPPTTTHHQLTATQALAVFDQLVKLGLPRNQMFTMAMASNRPRHPQGVTNGVSPNRRIELVIYPETYDGT